MMVMVIIRKMKLIKTIILPDKYLVNSNELDNIMTDVERSYEYLDGDKYSITKGNDRVFIKVEVKDDETIILNNINFFDND